MNGFSILEQRDTITNVERANSQLASDVSDLSSKTSDWAQWDDSYAFVQGLNQQYYQANVVKGSFINNNVNIMMFINDSGAVVCSRAFDHNGTEIEVPPSLFAILSANGFLWHFTETTDNVSGVIILPEGPLLIASFPITTSSGEGPIMGALIWARFLDARETQVISNTAHLPIVIDNYDDPSMPSDFQNARSVLVSNNNSVAIPVNSTVIGGYALIDDVAGKPALILRIEMPRNIIAQGQTSVSYFTLVMIATQLIFIYLVMKLLDITALSRLKRLTDSVSNIAKTKSPNSRVVIGGNDELSNLGIEINNMLSEIEDKTLKLQKTERLATIGELAAMVGHDLRNPLTGIENSAFYLKRKMGLNADENTLKVLDLIGHDVKYSNKIVNDLLEYSREIHLDLEETTPNSLVTDALAKVSAPEGIKVVNNTQESPKIMVDKDKMLRTFINLISNAFDAMSKGGTLTLASTDWNGSVDFRFSDTGIGMSKETLQKIWTPLFTTKAKGMGFGLPICKRLVEAHKGKIKIDSEAGVGTTFTITLPVNPLSGEVKKVG
jgi:signal transduction histidine kinase